VAGSYCGAALTVIEKVPLVYVVGVESMQLNVNVNGPADPPTVPEIRPEALTDKPVGKVPPALVHVPHARFVPLAIA
jgi:hypothetical protein